MVATKLDHKIAGGK